MSVGVCHVGWDEDRRWRAMGTHLDCGIGNHPWSDLCNLEPCQEVMGTLCLCRRIVWLVEPVCQSCRAVSKDFESDLSGALGHFACQLEGSRWSQGDRPTHPYQDMTPEQPSPPIYFVPPCTLIVQERRPLLSKQAMVQVFFIQEPRDDTVKVE